MNYRRVFATFALPYLLYLEALKPPGMGSGRDEDEFIFSDDDSIEDDEGGGGGGVGGVGMSFQSHVSGQPDAAKDWRASPAHSSDYDSDDDGSKGGRLENDDWIYKGARDVNNRRGTQIFNHMQTLR